MCWELIEVALCLNIDCSSPWEASISLLNLIISYGSGKCSQFVIPRCGNYFSVIYRTCFRSTHQKTVMFLPFKFRFQNSFSELKQIVEMNHKDLAEPRMLSSRFAWVMVSPDRQSISWWDPSITDPNTQNKLCCCMFTMILLSNLSEKNVKSFFVHSFSLRLYYYLFSKLHFTALVIFIFCLLKNLCVSSSPGFSYQPHK